MSRNIARAFGDGGAGRASARTRLLRAGLVLGDMMIAIAAIAVAYFARFEGSVTAPYQHYIESVIVGACVVVPLVYAGFGLYGYVWRHVGVDMLLRLAGAVLLLMLSTTAVVKVVSGRLGHNFIPVGVIIISGAFLFIGGASLRATARLGVYVQSLGANPSGRKVLIAGAGDAGVLLLRDIELQPGLGISVVGFVDDDPAKRGRRIRALQVLGPIGDIPRIVRTRKVEEVVLAIPSADQTQRSRALEYCARAGVAARIIPSMAAGSPSVGVSDLREVKITDLLGREPVPVDIEGIRQTIDGLTIAVTGAAGSIGSELCRQLLIGAPKRIVMIEIDESRLYELFLEMQDKAPGIADMRICDVRDASKLHALFQECRPDVVIHAAAYKHVPLMELEPDEAVKTNVLGTQKVVDACVDCGVDRFVLISTDKAVNPKSVMGATKALAERIALDGCRRGLQTSVVRFGNVLGSRGSVVPLFEGQLKRGGPLMVTHPDVSRYFMTIPEAARLVLQAQALSDSGDVFVLDMGEPVKIVDLARMMITLSGSNAGIEFTGLRPAEKLHEVLTSNGEQIVPTTAAKVMRMSAVPIPIHDLNQRLDDIAGSARARDGEDLRVKLEALVPGFVAASGRASHGAPLADTRGLDPEMETVL